MRRMSKTLALISGPTLTLTGLIAFVPNPLVGPGASPGRFARIPMVYADWESVSLGTATLTEALRTAQSVILFVALSDCCSSTSA